MTRVFNTMVCHAILFAFLTASLSYHCHADMLQFQDFDMLACSQKRNVTIIVDNFDLELLDDFFHHSP